MILSEESFMIEWEPLIFEENFDFDYYFQLT